MVGTVEDFERLVKYIEEYIAKSEQIKETTTWENLDEICTKQDQTVNESVVKCTWTCVNQSVV